MFPVIYMVKFGEFGWSSKCHAFVCLDLEKQKENGSKILWPSLCESEESCLQGRLLICYECGESAISFNTLNLGKSNYCTYIMEGGTLYFLLEFDVFLFGRGIRSDYDFLWLLIGTCWVHGSLWSWTFVFLVGPLISSLGLNFCIVIYHEVPGIYPSWSVSFDI